MTHITCEWFSELVELAEVVGREAACEDDRRVDGGHHGGEVIVVELFALAS